MIHRSTKKDYKFVIPWERNTSDVVLFILQIYWHVGRITLTHQEDSKAQIFPTPILAKLIAIGQFQRLKEKSFRLNSSSSV